MATKPLKSLKFPTLDDTYTVPQVDDTLAVQGAAADAKKVGDELTDLKGDISESVSDLNAIDGLFPTSVVPVTNDDFTTYETGKYWKSDGTFGTYIYALAVAFPVSYGQCVIFTGSTNSNASFAVRWLLSDDTIVSETTYDTTQPLANKEFPVPRNATSALISVNFYTSVSWNIKIRGKQPVVGEGTATEIANNAANSVNASIARAMIDSFGWSANGLVPINYDTLSNGYLNTSGVMQDQSATNLELTTDYILIPTASVIQVTATASNNAWLRIILYTSEKSYIRDAGTNTAPSGSTTATVTFAADYNAAYMRVSYRSFGNKYACTVARINNYNASTNLMVSEAAGYIMSNGAIGTQDSTTKEVHTGLYPLVENASFEVLLSHSGSVSMWIAYVTYDENYNFISRTVLYENYNYAYKLDMSATVINGLISNGAKYIAFSYKTYGEHGFYISTSNKTAYTQNVYVKSDEENAGRWSSFVKGINHRGYNTIAPENTLPAYRLSRKMGFEYAECDVSFTSDGVPVLLHDLTINRTARNTDGSAISETINISSITYEQALNYDFGVWKGAEYTGTKIPTLKQIVTLCRNIGLHLYIEFKADGTTEALVRDCVDIVNECNMLGNVTFISFSYLVLGFVKTYEPSARIGYLVMDGITDSAIQIASEMKTSENEVIIDSKTYTSAEVSKCKSAGLPLEIWTINDVNTIQTMDAYISGVISDSLMAGKVLYDFEVGSLPN